VVNIIIKSISVSIDCRNKRRKKEHGKQNTESLHDNRISH